MNARPRDFTLARKLRKAGFQNALRTIWEARRTGLPLSYAMASLDIESGRGQNVFGNDLVANPVRGGLVTKERYLLYKHYRDFGQGMQGVGPMQLTWKGYQDAADAMGGAWRPIYNMRVGFKLLADLIKTYGPEEGARRFNGTGPAADAYGKKWLDRQQHWHRYLSS